MTGLTSNIDQLIERFKIKRDQAQNLDLSPALIAGVTAARGAMSNRIFNQGKDTGNKSLGPYRGKKQTVSKKQFQGRNTAFLFGDPKVLALTPHMKKRVGKGRQIRYKDLELTGTLRRGIVVIQDGENRVVCIIPHDDLIKIARGQEEYLQTKIFGLSDEERQIMSDTITEIANQIYVRFLNS